MVKEHFIGLIDKYLFGTATAGEKELLEEYLERLESTENKIIDNEQEQKLKEEMWHLIQLQTLQQTPQVRISWYKREMVRAMAVAASIILIIGLGILLFTNNSSNDQSIAIQREKRSDSKTLSFIHHEINTTGKVKTVLLSDGSLILLADGSEVIFSQPFVDRRDISLIGKAFFKVTEDVKPFTVVSGDISTTALGTEFTVTAFRNEKQIVVRLYKGKVVIKAVNKHNNRLRKDIYLLPGQAFIYDIRKANLKSFKLNKEQAFENIMNEEMERDNPSIPQNTQGSWYMFNNQSLDQVLNQLAAIYNVKIIYSQEDVQKIYFTARYKQSEPIEIILKRVGTLNNLKVTKTDTAFILSK